MESGDLYLTLGFIIVVIVLMVLIYFYNVRHQLIIEDEVDEYEIENKNDKVVVKKDDEFLWDLYETDVTHKFDHFLGFEKWKDKEEADKRIGIIKKAYLENGELLLTTIEAMMLIEKSSGNIILEEDGIYRVGKLDVINFVEGLEYGLETIELLSKLKEQINFNLENFEVDARKLFYIMRNAKTFGLYNLDDNSQIFMFARKSNSLVIDETSDKKDIGIIKILVEEFVSGNSSSSFSHADKETIINNIKVMRSKTKVEIDKDGNRVIEFENGQKIIKKDLWTVEEVEPDIKLEKIKENKSEFQKVFQASSVDEVLNHDNVSLNQEKVSGDVQRKQEIITSEKNYPQSEYDNSNMQSAQEINNNFDPSKTFEIENDLIKRATLKGEDGNKLPLIDSMGIVQLREDFAKKLSLLRDSDIKTLLIYILSIDAAKINIDEKVLNMIVLHNNNYFISIDYINYVLASLVKNRTEFLKKNGILTRSGTISYGLSLEMEFFKELENREMSIFDNIDSIGVCSVQDGVAVLTNSLRLNKHGADLLEQYNSAEKIHSVNSEIIEKKEYRLKENKIPISFKLFVKIQ